MGEVVDGVATLAAFIDIPLDGQVPLRQLETRPWDLTYRGW